MIGLVWSPNRCFAFGAFLLFVFFAYSFSLLYCSLNFTAHCWICFRSLSSLLFSLFSFCLFSHCSHLIISSHRCHEENHRRIQHTAYSSSHLFSPALFYPLRLCKILSLLFIHEKDENPVVLPLSRLASKLTLVALRFMLMCVCSV